MSIWIVCIGLTLASALNPGFRLRVTQDGINYANKVAGEAIAEDIQNTRLDEVNGEKLGIQFKLYELIVRKSKAPKSTLSLATKSDLEWKGTEIEVEIDGKFQYTSKLLSGSGSFTLIVSGTSFSVGIRLGSDAGGKPTIKTDACSCAIGKMKIKFDGKHAWLYNFVSGLFENLISRKTETMVCEKVQDLINKEAEKALCSLKVQISLSQFYTLDYRLLSTPTVTSEYIEGDMKGEVFWTKDMTEAPFNPPEMTTIVDNNKMVYLTLSDYIFNTFTYQAYKHDMLVYNLTSNNIKTKKDILNTSCNNDCIGNMIPQIGLTYPYSQVEMHMRSTEPPVTSISQEAVTVLTAGNVTLYVRTLDNNLHYLFRVYAMLVTTVKIKIKEQTLFSNIESMEVKTNITNSSLGELNGTTIQLAAERVIKEVIKPTINGYLTVDGLPLPSTDNLEYKDSDLKLFQNTILVETNLKYIPPLKKRKSTIFKFKPKERTFPALFNV